VSLLAQTGSEKIGLNPRNPVAPTVPGLRPIISRAYFKLRDIGTAIGFGVAWDETQNTIAIDTRAGYAAEDEAAEDETASIATEATPKGEVEVSTLSLIGATIGGAEAKLGNPYRVLDGNAQYRFYGDSERFAMLAVQNGSVAYIYTNYDLPAAGEYLFFKDDRGGGRTYAVSAGVIGNENPSVTEAIIFETVNAFRAFCGISAFRQNGALTAAARAHSEDMAARDYFDHYSPDGTSPGARITAAGYKWQTWGENIIAGYDTGIEAVDRWIHSSSGHREQIINTSFVDIGVGCTDKNESTWGTYSTLNFGYPL
jgi:hypothetical protein